MGKFVVSCLSRRWLRQVGIPVIASGLLAISCSGCGDINGGVASLTISPSSTTVGISNTQLFTAVAKDSSGKIVSASPTWSVSSGIGSISSSGLFTAGATAGQGTVTATYSGQSGSASVVVTDKGWVEGRVTDSAGYRIQSIKVSLRGTSLHDFTDSDGDYSISDVPAADYVAETLETDVYRSASKEVTVASGETTTANFTIYYFTDPPDLSPPEL